MSQKYIKSQNKNSHNAKTLVKDVAFEEAHGKAVASTSNAPGNGSLTPNPSPTGEGSGNSGGNNNGGGGDDETPDEN